MNLVGLDNNDFDKNLINESNKVENNCELLYDTETGVQYYKIPLGNGGFTLMVRQGQYTSIANNHYVTMDGSKIICATCQEIKEEN